MQKAVGSSPIIRLYTLQNGIFGCLFGQHDLLHALETSSACARLRLPAVAWDHGFKLLVG